MRKVLLNFLRLAVFSAVLSGALALGAQTADAASAVGFRQHAPQMSHVTPVDYYWHHRHWHHRHWRHHHWEYD